MGDEFFTKFVTAFGDKLVTNFVTKFGDKSGDILGDYQIWWRIYHQIWWHIRWSQYLMINPFGENQVITKFGDEFVTTIWGKTGHQIGHQFWWQIGWPDCKIWWEIWWEIWWVTKWGDEFVTRFGNQLSESPNLVTNLSPNFQLLPRWSYMI